MPEFDNGLPANRQPDSVDRQQVVPAALHVYDSGLQAWVPAASMGGGGGTPAAPASSAGNIAGGTSTGASVNLAGLSVIRIVIGAAWTAADLSFETSEDGVTWGPLYDGYGSLIVYKAAASRQITVPVGDLLRVSRVRVRSGVPGAYVNQVATAGVTLVTAGL